jgi:hypothetical protein
VIKEEWAIHPAAAWPAGYATVPGLEKGSWAGCGLDMLMAAEETLTRRERGRDEAWA